LRILSSVFFTEIFEFRDKELKYENELLLNQYRKSVQNSEAAGHVQVELKQLSPTIYARCFEVVYTRRESRGRLGLSCPFKTDKNIFHHLDFVQFGKQHSRYKAILPSTVLSQLCCEAWPQPTDIFGGGKMM